MVVKTHCVYVVRPKEFTLSVLRELGISPQDFGEARSKNARYWWHPKSESATIESTRRYER